MDKKESPVPAQGFLNFLMTTKRYWLTPVIITLVLLAILIFLTGGSVTAPFIYSTF